MPRPKVIKQSTHRYLEINDPEKAVGLWSHLEERATTLQPVGETRRALGRFLQTDVDRYGTYGEMRKALLGMDADGQPRKSCAQKLLEWEGKVRERNELPPKWLVLWRNFGRRLEGRLEGQEAPRDIQMFFGVASVGVGCQESHYHASRTFFLRKSFPPAASHQPPTAKYYVAVVLKPGGTRWWWSIDQTGVTWTDKTYDRLVIGPRGRLEWSPIQSEVIDERVAERDICLFEMEDDPLFRAVTDAQANPSEKYAHLSYRVEFFIRDPEGPKERIYLVWSVMYNEGRRSYGAHDRTHLRSVEVMLERKKDWANRCYDLTDAADADKAARWVVENNGCIALPQDPPKELRHAAMRALYYIAFPDRPPDAVGGLLRGYQLPGRMLEHFPMAVRNYGLGNMIAAMKKKSEDAAVRRRKLVVDTLFDRACRVVLDRNDGARIPQPLVSRFSLPSSGISRETIRPVMEAIGAREILKTAAWRWGFMEGEALKLFKPVPTAGSLKLPDLSLALCFEHRLGLTGNGGSVGTLVQTAPIRPLAESVNANPRTKEVFVRARRMWTPAPGASLQPIEYAAESFRILRDEGRYYFFAVPKFTMNVKERDFAFQPSPAGRQSSSPFPVKAYRLNMTDRLLSRTDCFVTEETYDFNKIVARANLGRCYLYAMDFGSDTWLADAVFTTANRTPCRIVATQPILCGAGATEKPELRRKAGNYTKAAVGAKEKEVALHVLFTFNPGGRKDGRKAEGRSWRSYCDAYPADATRPVIRWPVSQPPSDSSLRDACRRVVETDGILLTDAGHLDAALEAMSYVVTRSDDPYATGGLYYGYMLRDRVFYQREPSQNLSPQMGGPRSVAAQTGGPRSVAAEPVPPVFLPLPQRERAKQNRAKRVGRPLVEIVRPETARQLEELWNGKIESEKLSDKKTSKFFTLEAPIVIGEEFKEMAAREFRRVAFSGTMAYQLQLNRPAREVALGIWLARLGTADQTGKKGRIKERKCASRAPQ